MSRWIDAEWLLNFFEPYPNDYQTPLGSLRACVDDAPSIDICFCKDCEFENTRKCPPHRMGLIHDASDYCSYGIRKTDGADKHDEAVEALGHLIKHMKGADDEDNH